MASQLPEVPREDVEAFARIAATPLWLDHKPDGEATLPTAEDAITFELTAFTKPLVDLYDRGIETAHVIAHRQSDDRWWQAPVTICRSDRDGRTNEQFLEILRLKTESAYMAVRNLIDREANAT